jgi:hypothetical protein
MTKKQPGFQKLSVPGKDELRPNHRDAKGHRGPLAYVGEGTANIMDMGAPAGEWWHPTTSPARADFVAPEPIIRREKTAKPLLNRPSR